MQPLDKSKVPTGILYDRVAPFAVLDSFSTVTTTFTTSRNHFMQAWQELYDATYSNSSLLKPSQIKNVVNLKRRNDTIAIGAMNYRFDVLDGNSVQDNLLYRCMTLRAVPVCLTSPGRYF